MSAATLRKQGPRCFLAARGADLHSCGMRPILTAALCALAGCELAGARPWRGTTADAEGPVRAVLSGDRVISLVSPTELSALPSAARRACEAALPGGALLFCGEERTPRGQAYRVEKQYAEPWPHERAVVVSEGGEVLERSQTVPVARAPKHILATATRCGSYVERVETIERLSTPPHWLVQVQDRDGQVYAAKILSNGELDAVRRRTMCRVDS